MTQIGIDFGTTTTQIAFYDGGLLPQFYPIGPNRTYSMPSVIACRRDGTWVYGAEADREVPSKDCIVLRSFKRDLVLHGANAMVDVFGRRMPTTEIAAQFIGEAIRRAVRYGASASERAIICCPTDADHFYRSFARKVLCDNHFRADTLQHHVVEEPALAAHVMRELESFDENTCALLYDFGGGTFDAALVKIERDAQSGGRAVRLIYAAGDLELGGDDIDNALVQHVLTELKVPGVNISKAQRFQVRQACRRAKEQLTDEDVISIVVPPLSGRASKAVIVTRDAFDEIVEPLWQRSRTVLDRLARAYYAVAQSALSRNQSLDDLVRDKIVDTVICVGGTSKIPIIRRRLGDLFGPTLVTEYELIDAELAVAAGGALISETVSSTNVRQVAYACTLDCYDENLSPVGQPFVIKSPYTKAATLWSTLGHGAPGTTEHAQLPPSTRHLVLRFRHADQPEPPRECPQETTDDQYLVKNVRSAYAQVNISLDGSVRVQLDSGTVHPWQAPWSIIDHAAIRQAAEAQRESERQRDANRKRSTREINEWISGGYDQ